MGNMECVGGEGEKEEGVREWGCIPIKDGWWGGRARVLFVWISRISHQVHVLLIMRANWPRFLSFKWSSNQRIIIDAYVIQLRKTIAKLLHCQIFVELLSQKRRVEKEKISANERISRILSSFVLSLRLPPILIVKPLFSPEEFLLFPTSCLTTWAPCFRIRHKAHFGNYRKKRGIQTYTHFWDFRLDRVISAQFRKIEEVLSRRVFVSLGWLLTASEDGFPSEVGGREEEEEGWDWSSVS